MSHLENACFREVCLHLYAIWAHVDLTSSGLALWSHSSESAISTEPCSRLFQTSKVPEDPIHVHWDFREVSTEQVNQEGPSWMEGHLTDLAVQRGIEGTGGLLAKPAVGL